VKKITDEKNDFYKNLYLKDGVSHSLRIRNGDRRSADIIYCIWCIPVLRFTHNNWRHKL